MFRRDSYRSSRSSQCRAADPSSMPCQVQFQCRAATSMPCRCIRVNVKLPVIYAKCCGLMVSIVAEVYGHRHGVAS
ncbi:hypothetical protein Y032_0046g1409 [Ancylostoma ceylanicum]|uniref:Uncharacterized protein n=1 Tax=Ancylostoma ceylanicum TaxID=53326 RepID=A0A016UDS2_9BILA|nr:hypothetical protein Y032_0046g1409 [Ancylostoma ceylanicum]